MPKTAITKRHKLSLNRERKLASKLKEIMAIVKAQCHTCGIGSDVKARCGSCSFDKIYMVASE